MAIIQIPVKVLDPHCATCRALSIQKQEFFYDSSADAYEIEYSCENLHKCIYIRNRIVRNEPQDIKKKDPDGYCYGNSYEEQKNKEENSNG